MTESYLSILLIFSFYFSVARVRVVPRRDLLLVLRPRPIALTAPSRSIRPPARPRDGRRTRAPGPRCPRRPPPPDAPGGPPAPAAPTPRGARRRRTRFLLRGPPAPPPDPSSHPRIARDANAAAASSAACARARPASRAAAAATAAGQRGEALARAASPRRSRSFPGGESNAAGSRGAKKLPTPLVAPHARWRPARPAARAAALARERRGFRRARDHRRVRGFLRVAGRRPPPSITPPPPSRRRRQPPEQRVDVLWRASPPRRARDGLPPQPSSRPSVDDPSRREVPARRLRLPRRALVVFVFPATAFVAFVRDTSRARTVPRHTRDGREAVFRYPRVVPRGARVLLPEATRRASVADATIRDRAFAVSFSGSPPRSPISYPPARAARTLRTLARRARVFSTTRRRRSRRVVARRPREGTRRARARVPFAAVGRFRGARASPPRARRVRAPSYA